MIQTAIDKSQWAPIEPEEHRHDFFTDWQEHPGSFFHGVGKLLAPIMAKMKRARGGMHVGKLNFDGVPIADYIVSWNRVTIELTPHGVALDGAKKRGEAFGRYLLGEFDAYDMADCLGSFGLSDFLDEYQQPQLSFDTSAEREAFVRGLRDTVYAAAPLPT